MDEFRDAVWRQAAGLVYTEDLPALAAEALAREVDSPALRELAGLGRKSDTAEILGLLRVASVELGIRTPGDQEAVRWWLRKLARDLVAGRVTVEQLTDKIVPGEAWMSDTEFGFAHVGYYWEELVDQGSPENVRGAVADLLAAAEAILAE